MRTISLALSLFLVSAPVAMAQTPNAPAAPNGPRGEARGGFRQGARGVSGDIATVDLQNKTLTVKNMRGMDTKVALTDQTVINRMPAGAIGGPGQQPPAAGPALKPSDLKKGTRVMVMGPRNADGSVTAQRILLLPPMVRGSVAKIDAASITVTDPAGKPVVLKLDAKTRYMKNRQPATAADFKAGDPVMVQYEGDRAIAVRSGFAMGGGRGAMRGGRRGGMQGAPQGNPNGAGPDNQ